MIQKAVVQFSQSEDCDFVHLPFFFTPDVSTARKGGLDKARELFRVFSRLLKIHNTGPIDLCLYPVGGPQRVPLIRDLLLLPWVILFSRRVVLHFHAAGIADRLDKGPDKILAQLVALVYRRAYAAIVMTNFNRRDPDAIGMKRVTVVPHRIVDEFDPSLLRRGESATTRLLYVGHLCPDKGTPELLQAFAALQKKLPGLEVDLIGECLPPFRQSDLEELLDKLQIKSKVRVRGVVTGRAKSEAFAGADLFVFPTVAPYESFGLVLVEAMSWGLPIVASNWRGNADVLTPRAGAIRFPTSPSLAENLTSALASALEQRGSWPQWGEINRQIFEERYRENSDDRWLANAVLQFLPPGAGNGEAR